MKWFALVAVIVTGSLLIYGESDFPAWSSLDSPANSGVPGAGKPVSQSYIEDTAALTHVPNVVTAVLADYRGYDTMFETVVILVAGVSIFAILRIMKNDDNIVPAEKPLEKSVDGDHQRIIIATTCRILIPMIQIFALYVVAHGHHSPGGGFQGGVMLGASFIVIGLFEDVGAAIKRFTERQFMALACIGIFIYAGFGLLPLFFGRNFLDYGALQKVFFTADEAMARSHSMLGVEIGVACTVMAIMFAIYAILATKGNMKTGL